MKLYALLVGINRYRFIRGLNACETDVKNMKAYLKETHGSDANIKTLIDQEATRDQIVSAFSSHLRKAKKGDVVLFYFSGHGVRQKANSVFLKASLNDYVECITCHDTTLDGKNLLSDKEIRWLIADLYQATQAHILVVFDSCHSGDATRDIAKIGDSQPMKRVAVALASNAEEQARLPELILPERAWSDYIFAKKIDEKTLKTGIEKGDSLDYYFPQGNHIHLAAASSHEPAWETGGTGLFTKSLIEVLKSSHENISYYDFRSMVYQKLNRFFGGSQQRIRQSPQIYSFGESIFQPFFGGIVQQKGIEANLYYNEARHQWELDMGLIYGIPQPTEQNPVSLLAQIDDEGYQTQSINIQKVFSDYAVIDLGNAESFFKKDKLNGYKCLIKKWLQKPLKLAYIGNGYEEDWVSFITQNTVLLDLASVIPVKKATEAGYVINTEGGVFFIATPSAAKRPLVEQVEGASTNEIFKELLKQLEAVSRWEFVKKHENTVTQSVMAQNALKGGEGLLSKVKIDIQDSKKVRYTPKNGVVDIHFNFRKLKEAYFSDEEIGIQITNISDNILYVAAAWLGERFGMDTQIINQNSLASPLEAGKTVNLWGSTTPFMFKSYMVKMGWDKFSNFMKLYVSDAPFNITLLQQMDLNEPFELRSNNSLKAVGRPEPVQEDIAIKTAEWAAETVEFVIHLI